MFIIYILKFVTDSYLILGYLEWTLELMLKNLKGLWSHGEFLYSRVVVINIWQNSILFNGDEFSTKMSHTYSYQIFVKKVERIIFSSRIGPYEL